MGKVRLADIAERVGVSTVTVHNALSGQRGVSEEMRLKIQGVAEELGYRSVSSDAGKERHSRFRNIGVIISEKYLAEYTTFYWKMYQEMALSATEKKCFTAVEVLKHEQEERLELPDIVQEGTVEGIIIMGEISRSYIRSLRERTGMPVIYLDFYDKEIQQDAVIADNFYGMYLLTEYLFEQGLRKLAYVGNVRATSSIMDRYCGFYKAMQEHDEDIREEWIIDDRDMAGQIAFDLPEVLPEAFVCNCDLVAGTLIMKLEDQGYRVPEDVSVIGFDNYLYPGFPDKKITTYDVNTKAMAGIALDKVLKQIKNPRSGRGLNVVSGHIVLKETVKIK